jgi:hypothetical protein
MRILCPDVEIEVAVDSVAWAFGDGATEVSTGGPGRPFRKEDGCHRLEYSDWFGHVYTQTSDRITVAARPTWRARFRVVGGAWTSWPRSHCYCSVRPGVDGE